MKSKKLNLFIIFAIFAIPIALYFVLNNSFNEDSSDMVQASASKPVVIDFSSPMCIECKELKQVFDPLEAKYKSKIVFKKVNVSAANATEQQLIKKYNVSVVPTLVFINKDGEYVGKTEGSMSQAQLERCLKNLTNG